MIHLWAADGWPGSTFALYQFVENADMKMRLRKTITVNEINMNDLALKLKKEIQAKEGIPAD